MANRPIFVSESTKDSFINEVNVEFQWFPGMAVSQKQKSINSLHNSASNQGLSPILEISSKSENPLGVRLSAFNLKLRIVENILTTVETAYQGSKVFKNGGPYTDLYNRNSREAKKDERLFESGNLIGFELDGVRWELIPETSFYDWIYINALKQNEDLADGILRYKSFSDIEYNPKKQVSCQARSAAYFVSLSKLNLLNDFLTSKKDFLQLYNQRPNTKDQLKLNL